MNNLTINQLATLDRLQAMREKFNLRFGQVKRPIDVVPAKRQQLKGRYEHKTVDVHIDKSAPF